MTWKNMIKKEDGQEGTTDEDKKKYDIIAPLLEKIEEYMKKHNLDKDAQIKEAFEQLEFELMVDIGYTGEYEPDEGTPMEDAMYRERERQGDRYSMM